MRLKQLFKKYFSEIVDKISGIILKKYVVQNLKTSVAFSTNYDMKHPLHHRTTLKKMVITTWNEAIF